MKTIAILTPTYNRGYILHRLFDSLLKQTDFDFKWYIIDDGSTDDTEEKCKGFKNDKFEIVYIKKVNGGKHTALNTGIKTISEELTLIVDSDDYLEKDAVKTIVKDWDAYKNREDVAGLCYYKMYENGSVVGQKYPSDTVIVDTYTNLRVNRNIRGDKAEVYRTEVLMKYPFPEFQGEKFLSEAIVWNAIGRDGFNLAFIGKGIYFCEYLPDGLSAAGKKNQLQNPFGTMEHAKSFLYKSVKFKLRIKYMLLYTATRPFAKTSIKKACKELDGYKTCYLICLFPGLLLSRYWKIKYKL